MTNRDNIINDINNSNNEIMKKYIDENIDLLVYMFKDKNMLAVNLSIFLYLKQQNIRGFDADVFDKHLRKYRIYTADYFLAHACGMFTILGLVLCILNAVPYSLSIYNDPSKIFLNLISNALIGCLVGVIISLIVSLSDNIKFHRIPKSIDK